MLSGGYEDDQDLGNEIVYTGHGGRDQQTGRQVSDQAFTRGNRALALSSLNGLPIRVVRGSKNTSPYSPAEGYRYDGLFLVDDYWQDTGRSGFLVWRYRLIKIPDTPRRRESSVQEESGLYGAAPRREETISRIVRDTAMYRSIKVLYDYRCQACGIRLETAAGPYVEAAHIRPLGTPHNGPDSADNILCLCPNHHVLFDYGELIIGEDLSLEGEGGRLKLHPRHRLNPEHLQYRREHYARDASEPTSQRGS